MGKPKKGKKGQADDEFSDEDVVIDPLANMDKSESVILPVAKATKKKNKKKRGDDDWDDDVSADIAALSLDLKLEEAEENGEVIPAKKKEKKKKKKKEDFVEDEDGSGNDLPVKSKSKKKPASSFQLLMMDDDDSFDDKMSDDEPSDKGKKDEIVLESISEKSSNKKKDKKSKKKEKAKPTEEDDIDAIIAQLDKPTERKKKKGKKTEEEEAMETNESEAVVVPEGKVVTMEDMEAEYEEGEKKKKKKKDKKEKTDESEAVAPEEGKVVTIEDMEAEYEEEEKKKKKKGKREKKEEKTEEASEDKTDETAEGKTEEKIEGEKEGEEDAAIKLAIQKRKEKREREKQRKLEKKKEEKAKKKDKDRKKDENESVKAEEKEEGAAEEEDEASKKKKKGDNEKEEKKEEKPDKPKTRRAPIAAIKAHLKMIQEEEERLKREEEERIRKEEEEEREREEKSRLDAERREKKRQKERERRERLKAEGKLLTAKQKMNQNRLNQMLEAMKAQGLEVPDKNKEQKKKPVYGDKKRKKEQPKVETEQTPSPEVEKSPVIEQAPKKEAAEETVKKEEEVKGSWDDDEADDVKDAWDMSDEEEEEEKKEEVVTEKKETESKPGPSKSKPTKEEEESEEESETESEEEESDEESESETESSEEESSEEDTSPIEKAREKIEKYMAECEKKRSTDNLRAPVVCVLGHVDTGKTKILDKLRRTHVQDGEAGGITQQIGATNVPKDAIMEQTKMCKDFQKKELKVPGLLIIDTPGHESFSNLRSRGSSLCDIAILVVDIMHGLEPQTIESINLLKEKGTPYVIALNKVDRLYQWKTGPGSDIVNVLKKQLQSTQNEFKERMNQVILQMAEQGLNAILFNENKDPDEYISMIPTSAHSGDGMGNLIALICEMSQTTLAKRVSYSEALHATVMEVKALPGLGTTIDVILVNGHIKEGATVVLAGTEGPIVTQIRGLLMPQPMKELRVKNQYEHHKEVRAAQGVKIIAKDLEKSLAGLPLYVAHDQDEVEFYKNEVALALKDVLESIKLSERGVFVQASTLGSLEALLEFLRTSKIPYAGINIGPVHRKDIMKASIMLEHNSQYAVILAFDVKVEREAQEMADSLGVKIFTADIIYHLFDRFMEYRAELKRQKQEEFKHIAVFPCRLRVLPQYIFNSRDPIIIGVSVENGFIKEGTPLCVPSREFVDLGRVVSIENNHKNVDMARQGQEVCIKIEAIPGETPKLYGRHFDHTDLLVSKISRQSIDAVKDYFRDEMQKQDWMLIVELKKQFEII